MTDREQVPWGKGEKYPDEGSEKDLKPYAYKQSKIYVLFFFKIQQIDGVPFA